MWTGVLDVLESLLASNSDCYDHNWGAFMQADVLGKLLVTEKVQRRSYHAVLAHVATNCSSLNSVGA